MFLLSTTLFYFLHNFTISKEKGANKKGEAPATLYVSKKKRFILYYILKVQNL